MADWSDNIIVTDLADEPHLSDELNLLIDRLETSPDETRSIVVNFANVTYVSSSNLAQLLTVRNLLKESARQLRLCGVSDDVWSVMLVTGLDKIFQFAPDLLTAIASLHLDEEAS